MYKVALYTVLASRPGRRGKRFPLRPGLEANTVQETKTLCW